MSAALLARLIESGTPAELVAEVAMELARAEAAQEVLESRRKNERERKARSRDVTGQDVTERERQEVTDTPSPEVSPQTPFPNPNLSPPAPKGASPQIFVQAWNQMAERTGLPAVKTLTPDRAKRLKARIAEHGEEQVLAAIGAVGKSNFCLGRNDRGWMADFDFLLQPKSCARLIEGGYGAKQDERLTV